MKRCPTCNKTFTERQLTFCVDDGTPLVDVDASSDETTVVRPSWDQAGPSAESDGGRMPPYQPPGSYLPPNASAQTKRRTGPWVIGILVLVLLVFAGIGIAAVILIPRMMQRNTNASNANVARHDNSNWKSNTSNSNSSSNTTQENENNNDNSAAYAKPPTDQQAVLTTLKDLEDDWTVANINADKKKLDHILADDYVDKIDGKSRGKAEYLKTAQRDSAIQKWAFEDVKVSLTGDRATLSGTVRFVVKDQQGQDREVPFTFTDKFVWRDGRWQATGSEVNPFKSD